MRIHPILLALPLAVAACHGDSTPAPEAAAPAAPSPITLNGAGSTFIFPLFSKWVGEYQQVNPDARINYQSIGSGGGVRQITERTVDFGASDVAMNDDQLAKAPGKLIHFPMTLGAAVLTYNLPSVTVPLKLTPTVLASIFLGQITKWNDPQIAAANPGVTLPADTITVMHRSDGSGTSALFTDYLSKVSPDWKSKVGTGTSVNWPTGVGAKGNEGVTGGVKTTPGAIGYTELAYAIQNKLPVAELQNQAGKFIAPAVASITAAADSMAGQMPDDLRLSIVNAPGAEAYPIASFSYVIVYEDAPDRARASAVAHFLWWAIHDGQKFGPPLNYATLPQGVVTKAEARLKLLKGAGTQLLTGM